MDAHDVALGRARRRRSGAAFRNEAFVMNGNRRKSSRVQTSPAPSIPRCERQVAESAQQPASSGSRTEKTGLSHRFARRLSRVSFRAAFVRSFSSPPKNRGRLSRPLRIRMAGYKKGREGGSPTSTAEKYARGGGSSAATTSGY